MRVPCFPTSQTTQTPTGGSDTPCTGHRSKAAIREDWPVFAESILERLAMGAEAYGDRSFDAPAERLCVEIEQELMDVVGWGFILWHRLQRIKAAMAEAERRHAALAVSTATRDGQ